MDYRITFVLQWIHDNLPAAISLRDMSSKTGLSTSQFYSLFRNQTGVPPAAYIRKLRYERASELLIKSNLSVKEITGAVGIRDVSHFVRTFREIHGQSPKAFRHKQRLMTSMNSVPQRSAAVLERVISRKAESMELPGHMNSVPDRKNGQPIVKTANQS